MAEATERRTKKEAIEAVKEELTAHIHESRCHPIIVRLAWHDAGSYDKVRPHQLCRLALSFHPCPANRLSQAARAYG